jgi:hypothetical protein
MVLIVYFLSEVSPDDRESGLDRPRKTGGGRAGARLKVFAGSPEITGLYYRNASKNNYKNVKFERVSVITCTEQLSDRSISGSRPRMR